MGETHIQVFEAANLPLSYRTWPLPHELQRGEVLVEIELATICGSDLHTISGTRKEPTPCILGHEAVGQVVRKGSRRDELEIGQRVTWSLTSSCGECDFCRLYGLPQKCVNLFKYGHASLNDGSGLNGCYARHILLRGGTRIIPLPDKLSNQVAAPINCALATMVEALSHLPKTCTTTVIQGAGMLGLYGCTLLLSSGIKNVFCIDIDPRRLALVEQFGGIPIDGRDDCYPVEKDKISAVAPYGVDAVIEAAGVAPLVAEGIKLLRTGGYYVFVGLVHPRSRLEITGEAIIRKNLTIRGSHNYHPDRLQDAVSFLEATVHKFPYETLVSQPFPLAALDAAVKAAKAHQWPRISVTPQA